MRMFTRSRIAAIAVFAAASATMGGAAFAVANDVDVDVTDVADDVSVDALSNLLNDVHALSCDQTNVISNEGEANGQENEQTNRCVINVVKVKDVANDLTISDLLEHGINVLTEGS